MGRPSELLYADDLVLMAPTMEQLGRRVAEWRVSLFDKGLKVNVGKPKVIVGRSGGKMTVNSGKWLCGVCGKGVRQTLLRAQYVKSGFSSDAVVYVRCSGVRGDLSLVFDGFWCKQCDGTI